VPERERQIARRDLEIASRRYGGVQSVVQSDPATDALVRAFAVKCREFASLRAAVDVVQLMLTPAQRQLCVIDDHFAASSADAWGAALKALECDPDARLPEVA
jgi:hypothetical protein